MRLSRHYPFGLLALLITALPLSAQTPAGGSVDGQLLVDDQLVVGDLLVPSPPQTPATAAPEELVPPPSWARGDLACAPMLTMEAPKTMLRVVGSQDTVIKEMMGPPDTLIISGGSSAGLQPGQRYFVRRVIKSLMATEDRTRPLSVHTAGWIQILGVDTYLATATILYACDGMLPDDYLEPFTEPLIAARPTSGNTPEYQNMGRIVTADEAFQTAGAGQLMNINRGSNTGVVNGQRFLVFRDKRNERNDTTLRSDFYQALANRLPLVEIGEVLVVAVRPDDSTVQITVSRDAITAGDFVAPIR